MQAFLWREILKESLSPGAAVMSLSSRNATHPTHSARSVYFGHATVNPPGDVCCSCFMVEQTRLPFVWWESSWPLTLGSAQPFQRKGLCGVICLCSSVCGDACFWPETHSVWIGGHLLSKPDLRQVSPQAGGPSLQDLGRDKQRGLLNRWAFLGQS